MDEDRRAIAYNSIREIDDPATTKNPEVIKIIQDAWVRSWDQLETDELVYVAGRMKAMRDRGEL